MSTKETKEHKKQLDHLYETIQRLTRELRKREWISVERWGCPDDDGWYVCHFEDGTIETFHFDDDNREQWGVLAGFGQPNCMVTHWMHQPDPPVEECDPQCRSTSEGPCVGCPDE